MKVRLQVRDERYEEIAEELKKAGIEIDDASPLVLKEDDAYPVFLMAKDAEKNICRVPTADILFIESFAHDIVIRTGNGSYHTTERLRDLETVLDPDRFLRVSNSVIIAKDRVRKIKPSLFCKFLLTMTDGSEIVVTRSYYYIFKDQFHI